MDDTEKDSMNMRYPNMISHCQCVNYATFPLKYNNGYNKELKDRERIAKQIAKTNDLIRKKYHALKTGKINEDIALKRHFQSIVEPLKQIVKNIVNKESQLIKKEVNIAKDKIIKKRKSKDNEDNENDDNDNDDDDF